MKYINVFVLATTSIAMISSGELSSHLLYVTPVNQKAVIYVGNKHLETEKCN
jgi:hypothetical protein